MEIYCCNCESNVPAELVKGDKIYPHRKDLYKLNFWQCGACDGYVGCHKNSSKSATPLGVIPTPEIRSIRHYIHYELDPLWKSKKISRKNAYKRLSDFLGRQYHTAELRTEEECFKILEEVKRMKGEINE